MPLVPRRRPLGPALVVCLLLLCPLLVGPPIGGLPLLEQACAKESRLARTLRKERTKIALVWVKLAQHLARADLKAEAERALERAALLAPDAAELAEVTAIVAALAGAGVPTDATAKRIQKGHADAAKGHDKLAKLYTKHGDEGGALRETHAALALDPSKKRIQSLATAAMKGPLLLTSPTHAAAAFVSLPRGWKPGKRYPVLVSVDGAGANFHGNARAFAGGRGARAFITVSPHALSCTNAIKPSKFPAYSQALIDEWDDKRVAFDVPGLLAMLDFLHAHFGAEEKVAITGFSGGGNLCYGFLLRHPDRVFCAAPACANFQPGLAQGAVAPDAGGPPVLVMTGENDPHRHLTHGKTPPGIEQQTDWAMEAFKEKGFTNVTRSMLPGVGHSNLVRQVWAFVDETRE